MASRGDSMKTAERTLPLFDTFSEPAYISIDDPYPTGSDPKGATGKGATQAQTHTLKPFIPSSPVKHGKTDDVLLQKGYVPLASGDPYINMDQLARQEHLEDQKRRKLAPFVPASPSKKSVGKGSLYGTINPPPEHMAEREPVPRREPGTVRPSGPRNFLTNPMKKGGYGYYHTTIGGVEYPYSVDDPSKAKERDFGSSKRRAATTQGNSRPFVSMSHGNKLFTGNSIYSTEGVPVNPRSLEAQKGRLGSTSGGSGESRVPFKSMCAPGQMIGKFPEYMVTSEPKKNPREGITHEKVWKPSGTNTFTPPSVSIATMGLGASKVFNRSRGL